MVERAEIAKEYKTIILIKKANNMKLRDLINIIDDCDDYFYLIDRNDRKIKELMYKEHVLVLPEHILDTEVLSLNTQLNQKHDYMKDDFDEITISEEHLVYIIMIDI